LLPAIAGAQANVQVDANTVVRASIPLYGVNTTIWDPEMATAQTFDLLTEAGISFLRLPGGSLSDEYHWLTNTSRDNTWKWASGFDKSSWLLLNRNGTGMVTVNYGSGTPEEAAAWVAYANFEAGTEGDAGDVDIGIDSPAPGAGSVPARNWMTARHWANLRAATPLTVDDGLNFLRLGRTQPMDIPYWEVGNENYGSWEFDLQAVPQDPVTYATRARAYIDAIHAVDPSARVGVVVVTGDQYNNWTSTVLDTLDTLGTRPDFVIYHRYEQGPGSESDAALLQAASSWPNDIADIRAKLVAAFGATDAAAIEIHVTENNSVYTSPGKQSTSLVNGLFLADSLGQVMKTETAAFAWWALRNGPPEDSNNSASLYGWRNYGDYGILSTPSDGGSSSYYEAYPTYYAFKLMKFFASSNNSIVAATSDDDLLSVFAASSIYGTNILVINKDPDDSRSANFTLSGVTPGTETYVFSYGKANDDAARPDGTGCRDIVRTPITVTGNTFTASFEPYSMSVISLNSPQPALTESGPVFVAQPVDDTVTAGAAATFTGGARGCPAPSYRWQRAPAGSSTFTDLEDGGSYSGTGTMTLTVSGTTTAMDGDQFRLVANVGGAFEQTAAAELSVTAAPQPPANPPSSGGGGGGGGLDLLLLAALAGLTFRRRNPRTN
jgi:alpha-L-arabinofuranosidase